MSRYIDKDKLIKDLKTDMWISENSLKYVLQDIKEQPEADVVEVVRCKDCKWWEKQENSPQGKCILFGNYPMYPTGGWYCANGVH